MGATGLASNPQEYRERLREQDDEQIYSWAAELMRDIAARRGAGIAIHDFKRTARLDDAGFRRVFAAGGGPPATVGRGPDGQIFVPAITLYCLVPGLRAVVPDAKDRLIEYLVANFEDLVYA